MPFATLINNSEDTNVQRDTRLTGLADASIARDLRSTGQLVNEVFRDVKLVSAVSPIAYSGPLVTASSTSSSSSFAITVPFVTAGSHVILAVTHTSGGNVTGATDSRGNTWTVDQPSTYNGSTGVAVVSAPILTSLQDGDNVIITWSAPVTHKAVVGEVFRGLLQATYVDRTASNTSANYLLNTGTTATTSYAKELVFGAFGVASGTTDIEFTPGSGYTGIQEANSMLGNAANRAVTGAFKIVSAQGAYNVTGSLAEPPPALISDVARDIRTTGFDLPALGPASVTVTRLNNTRLTVTGSMPASPGVDWYYLKGSTTGYPDTNPAAGTILAQGAISSGQAIPNYNWTVGNNTTGYARLIVRSTNSGVQQFNATATAQATT